jgi:hypothetical protein
MKRIGVLAFTIVLAACGRGQDSRIQFSVQGDVQTLRPLLTITATSGGWSLVVHGADIGTTESPNHTPRYRTPGAGTLTVSAVLGDSPGRPLASGSIQLDLRRDWVWGVDFYLTNRNPTEMCFGCMGYQAFPIPAGTTAEPDDSLFIVWGGNSISHPVVY